MATDVWANGKPCWCGDIHEPHCPTCDKCGAPITTGMMAMICPHGEQCHFWPDDPRGQAWARWWKNADPDAPYPDVTAEGKSE